MKATQLIAAAAIAGMMSGVAVHADETGAAATPTPAAKAEPTKKAGGHTAKTGKHSCAGHSKKKDDKKAPEAAPAPEAQ
jgi:hypothetical protein